MLFVVDILTLIVLDGDYTKHLVLGDHRHTQPRAAEPCVDLAPFLAIQSCCAAGQQQRLPSGDNRTGQALSLLAGAPILTVLRIHDKRKCDLLGFLIV